MTTTADEDQYEGYPPDRDEDGPGMNVPQPRSAAARGQARGMLAPGKPQNKNQAKRLKKASTRILSKEKQRQALEARKAGATYQTIAEKVGYHDASTARKAVIRAFNQVIQEPVTELKVIQMERLNHMLLRLWQRVDQGDDTAMRTALQIMDKIDRLNGTEEAQRVDVHQTNSGAVLVIDGDKDDFITAMKRMAGVDSNGQNIAAGGSNPKALPAAQVVTTSAPMYPPGMGSPEEAMLDEDGEYETGMDDVVDAEVVDDEAPKMSDCISHIGEVCKDGDCPLHFPLNSPAMPTKKFSFGVEPTVKR